MVDGEPVGMQDLIGADFAVFGAVSTFSWLGSGYRGRGIGTEMRAAALHLAFAGLAAREATSEAFTDNQASNRVSRALGYEPNGTSWATRRGDAALMTRRRAELSTHGQLPGLVPSDIRADRIYAWVFTLDQPRSVAAGVGRPSSVTRCPEPGERQADAGLSGMRVCQSVISWRAGSRA